MNHVVLVIGALLLTTARHTSAQPVCGTNGSTYNSQLCIKLLEELLRRTNIDPEYSPELFEPLLDRNNKRQEVDHVFLRFGR